MDKILQEQMLEALAVQEDKLRFARFNADQARALGNFLADRIEAEGIDLAAAIRRLNGQILFQYMSEGTALSNQVWMQRKFNTVVFSGHSSLYMWAKNTTPAAQGLDEREYAFCGGGFPIFLTSGEFVGVLTVSNLPHIQDHNFVIRNLSAWLHIPAVPLI